MEIFTALLFLCAGDPLTKGQWRGPLMFFLSVWTNLFECFMCGHDIFVGPEFVSIYSNYVNCNQRSRDWLIQMIALDFIRQLIPFFIVFTNSQYTLMWKIQQLLFKWIGPHTVYPKKYAHGFCFAVLCCGYTLADFPISIRLTSLALWQSNDCPSASKATLMNMDKYFMWIHYERLHNHNKAKHNKTVCIFLGIYCRPCLNLKI